MLSALLAGSSIQNSSYDLKVLRKSEKRYFDNLQCDPEDTQMSQQT